MIRMDLINKRLKHYQALFISKEKSAQLLTYNELQIFNVLLKDFEIDYSDKNKIKRNLIESTYQNSSLSSFLGRDF